MITEAQKISIGQRLSVGFDGFTIPDEYRELIRRYKVGNAILFRRNVQSFAQLKALCTSIRELILSETGHEPFIMIDEECGTVSRLAHVAAPTPCALAIGATEDPENATQIGRLIGQELRAVGLNLNLAPVLDCLTHPATAIGNRCFASEPEKVARFGAAYLRGLQETGVFACAKHFPGHGDTAVDSHLALPVADKPVEAIQNTELVSFQAAIDVGILGVMSSHVVYPSLDPERVPATLSRPIMTGWLREKMGFHGLILSDAIEMNAVKDMFGIPEGARRALAAGSDVALICHSAVDASLACEHLYEALQTGGLDLEETEWHYRHILDMKKLLLPPAGDEAMFGSPAQKALAADIMKKSLCVAYAPQGRPLPAVDGQTLFLGLNAAAVTRASDNIALDAAKECGQVFHARRIHLDDPLPENVQTAVVFLDRNPELEKAVSAANRLAATGADIIAVSMNVPMCLQGLDPSIWQIEAWQYDRLALIPLMEMLRNGK